MDGRVLRAIRTSQNISLSELANKVGVSTGYLCHLEKGTRKNPSINIMEAIAKELNCSVTEIFFS